MSIERLLEIMARLRDRLAAALREVSGLGGKTLLGPDSAHHMGEAAPRYHEMGAAAAFAQAAAIAEAALADSSSNRGAGVQVEAREV